MNISNDTINVLKNFASINPNIVFKPGQKLKTISESKTILASADIVEDFPVEFGVYDLNEFLSVLSLINNPHLEFEDNSVLIKSTGGGCSLPNQQKVKYFFSEMGILTQPSKDIQMPESEVGFNLTEDTLSQIRKAAAVLGHSELSFNGSDGVISASVFDSKDATANSYDIEIDRVNTSKDTFSFVFNIANLKILPGDYFVTISSKLISNWTNSNYPVEYFIALENTSKFGV